MLEFRIAASQHNNTFDTHFDNHNYTKSLDTPVEFDLRRPCQFTVYPAQNERTAVLSISKKRSLGLKSAQMYDPEVAG